MLLKFLMIRCLAFMFPTDSLYGAETFIRAYVLVEAERYGGSIDADSHRQLRSMQAQKVSPGMQKELSCCHDR